MARTAKLDPAVLAHLEWIGFVRPTGLVVSAPALVHAGAILERRDAEGQQRLRACVGEVAPRLLDFRTFAASVLDWTFSPKGYAGTAESPIPVELEVHLPEYGDTLRPDFAVRELDVKEGASAWQLLVNVLDADEDFDHVARGPGRLEASPHGRMERLLRETRVSAGLLVNGTKLRLLSAPRGESSGWLDFRLADMVQPAGRPICTALRLLLSQTRLLALPRQQRLAALLSDSRKFQNEVSERLAEQVLHALYELLRGFQAAHDRSQGALLREPLADAPDEVYRALLTVVLRLVFLLYAEERDLLPADETFGRGYSIAGLFDRLREDAALYPDTMDDRPGAWAQLLALFRMIHDGADVDSMQLPKRHGALFDPDRYRFLEGRTAGGVRQVGERIEPPYVSDGHVYRALDKLLVLDGERISYRALDVEQIGSVYETMMGFRLEVATGRSLAIKSQKKHGAPTTVDLEALLASPGAQRAKRLQDETGRKITDTVKKTVTASATLEDLHAALRSISDEAATPDLVLKGALVLQPSEERRRSGSHYTPRSLTKPIVETTLQPILARLRGAHGKPPTPAQILDLKVLDPAMGSGAFLVETCRQLAEALVEAWRAHGEAPKLPADENEITFARRLVAQRCLYGVDRNAVAVDLAKVSLWLVTLAKEHALTFVDHALRHGDSLVGLSRRQIEAFHWDESKTQLEFVTQSVKPHLERIARLRREIREADEKVTDSELRSLWRDAQFELSRVRLFGDLVIAAFFESEKPKEREEKRAEFAAAVVAGKGDEYRSWLEEVRAAELPFAPFHWEVEFPEVFARSHAGFDVVVGNPPFAGSRKIRGFGGKAYHQWLVSSTPESHGNADYVAYFVRLAARLLFADGCMGLVTTKSIRESDSRVTSLGYLCRSGATIYCASTAQAWPGSATVDFVVFHICCRAGCSLMRVLDGVSVEAINSRLQPHSEPTSPIPLAANQERAFIGAKIMGQGFILDDAGRERLVTSQPSNAERIRPYLTGEDVTTDPKATPSRWVVDFGNLSLSAASAWPELIEVVRERVLPERMAGGDHPLGNHGKKYWWQFGSRVELLYKAIVNLERCLVLSRVGKVIGLQFSRVDVVFSEALIVFAYADYLAFGVLQSYVHEVWVIEHSSTLGKGIRYTPTDCFETFPFPAHWETQPALEVAGRRYYDFRAALMVRNGEGLTKTYNRFHDPEERDPAILELRALHAAMDGAVLEAYDWTDIPTTCNFFLDYEIDEEEWADKKKPWRYRWPDGVRDEVLARLLKLNAERAREEAHAGAVAASKSRIKRAAPKRAPKSPSGGDFFA